MSRTFGPFNVWAGFHPALSGWAEMSQALGLVRCRAFRRFAMTRGEVCVCADG